MPLLYQDKKRDSQSIPKQHFNEVTFLPLRFSLPSAITAAFGRSDFRNRASHSLVYQHYIYVILSLTQFCLHCLKPLIMVENNSYRQTPCIGEGQTALWGATTIGNAVKKQPEEGKRASSFAAHCHERAVFLTLSSSPKGGISVWFDYSKITCFWVIKEI